MKLEAEMIVLGSRSPQRRELLRLIVPDNFIRVLPPRSTDELSFDGLHEWPLIEQRLLDIARGKSEDVISQIKLEQQTGREPRCAAVIAADTVIVVSDDNDDSEQLAVLGQPPADDTWPDVVREWFGRHYFGRTHTVVTAYCVVTPLSKRVNGVVKSHVTFGAADRSRLDWYISTGEPRGKAGGYALQGAGSIFISQLTGSSSNVVGLPLREILSALDELEIDIASHKE